MNADQYTNQEIMLDVGNGHQIYVHDWGNQKAEHPIVHLHGGPGSGTGDRHKSRYNPKEQRVIFHDQRGSGKSVPYGSLEHNTTDLLVGDIEKIAQKLNLSSFILTGGSWGSTLALMYALKHPGRVSKLVLTGIFTASTSEINWLDKGFFKIFYPELWQEFLVATPSRYHADPTSYHAKHILGSDPKKAVASARAYNELEGSIMSLDDRRSPEAPDEDFDIAPTRIETYYLQNKCFIGERFILDHAASLKMPVYIVQGRFDMVCPPLTAFELHERIAGSELIWTMAGHGNDRSTYDVLRTLLREVSR